MNLKFAKNIISIAVIFTSYISSSFAGYQTECAVGRKVLELTAGSIEYAGTSQHHTDGDNGILLAFKDENSNSRTMPVNKNMNLNDAPGQAILSLLKTAALTGISFKVMGPDSSCDSINAIILTP